MLAMFRYNTESAIYFSNLAMFGIFKELLHFFECVQGVSQPIVPIDQGIQVMKMIDAARESNDSGRVITL